MISLKQIILSKKVPTSFLKKPDLWQRALFSTQYAPKVPPPEESQTPGSLALALAKETSIPISQIRVQCATDFNVFRHISAVPVTASLGAEISGVDLSQPLSDDVMEEIWSAFLLFGVIFFREQKLTPDQQLAFAKRFGEPDRHPIVKGLESHPDVLEIVREAGAPTNFGEAWHSDNSYMAEPSLGSILHAVEVPPVGNDTMFSCAYGAYDGLSPKMRNFIDDLRAVHTAGVAFNPSTVSGGSYDNPESAMKYERSQDLFSTNLHPVVRVHPETGRRGIFVNEMFTTEIEGLVKSESKQLLELLFSQFGLPHTSCRFRWKAGDVAMWDNRCLQHVAIGDNSSHKRVMRRVTLKGDKPQ